MKPVSVNYHLTKACDSRCRFCFSQFDEVGGALTVAESRRLIDTLQAAGAEKITFAGGEPTLVPHLADLLHHSKQRGLVTGLVTNGYRLDPLLDARDAALDWVGFSVDSADERTQIALGRGHGDHVSRCLRLAERCRDRGIRVKLNTVVTAMNWWEDLSALVLSMRPERWKVLQVLPIIGQNDHRVTDLVITARQLEAFVQRHSHLRRPDLDIVVENNEAMRGSYVMVDPLGRFFGNSEGRHVYSEPILQVGVQRALAQVGYEPQKFEDRGGRYAW